MKGRQRNWPKVEQGQPDNAIEEIEKDMKEKFFDRADGLGGTWKPKVRTESL